ncbi:MAG: chemotaxis protein CheX [Oligoflexus sp.]|nr:chemotaxis protein CheX [Oligoflexus sp.]
MSLKLIAIESLMDEALIKSLDEFALERISAPKTHSDMLKTRLLFEGAGMKAQAFISCSQSFLQKTCPLPKGDADHASAVLKDWLGEMGNLILGRFKNRLLAHGVTIKISAPSFDGHASKNPNAQSIVSWYQIEDSYISLECLIEGEIPEIGEALKQTAEILPGDAIYRLNDPLNTTPSYDIISKIRSGIENHDEDEDEDKDDDGMAPEPRQTLASVPVVKAADPSVEKPAHKPIKILFHSQVQLHLLTGVAWSQLDKLCLHFSSGLEYTFCPKTLLDRGCSSLEVEDLVLQFQREGDMIRASIPKYNMHLSKPSRVA